MKFKYIVLALLVLALFLGREYLVLHDMIHGQSLLWWLRCHMSGNCGPLSVAAGKRLGHLLGWWGMFFILLTNLYSLRKRMGALQHTGNIQNWLGWHMAFGLLGPLLIIFHTNFRVKGLVAISFWSMIVVVLSGIIGRFFYIQLLSEESDLQAQIRDFEISFEKFRRLPRIQLGKAALADAKNWALHQVGCLLPTQTRPSLGRLALDTVVKSLFALFSWGGLARKNKMSFIRRQLIAWAILRRRLLFAESYKKILGYWHAVHLPFTQLMYVVVLVHILSSLIFGVH